MLLFRVLFDLNTKKGTSHWFNINKGLIYILYFVID